MKFDPVTLLRRRAHPSTTVLRALARMINAANGFRPLARKGYITLPVFAFGWPTSELAPVFLSVSALDALRRGVRGDFRGRSGRVALALHAVEWALLVAIQRRNVRSEPYFDAGLTEALGPDYRSVAATSQPAVHGGIFATGELNGGFLQANTITDNTGNGITLDSAEHLTVGGSKPGAGNTITGNTGCGLFATGDCEGTVVKGNTINTNGKGNINARKAKDISIS